MILRNYGNYETMVLLDTFQIISHTLSVEFVLVKAEDMRLLKKLRMASVL